MPFSSEQIKRIQNNDPNLTAFCLLVQKTLSEEDRRLYLNASKTNPNLRKLTMESENQWGLYNRLLYIIKDQTLLEVLEVLNFKGRFLFEEILASFKLLKKTGLKRANWTSTAPSSSLFSDLPKDQRIVEIEFSDQPPFLINELIDELINDDTIMHLRLCYNNVQNHGNEIARLISNHKTLKTLGLAGRYDKQELIPVIDALEKNNTLINLDLDVCIDSNEIISKLATLFSHNKTLQTFSLGNIEALSMAKISPFLNALQNFQIKELFFNHIYLGEDNLSALSEFLEKNNTCHMLTFNTMDLYEEIFNSLSKNKGITSITLKNCFLNYDNKGPQALINCIKNSKTIKNITLSPWKSYCSNIDVLRDILNQNVNITSLNLVSDDCFETRFEDSQKYPEDAKLLARLNPESKLGKILRLKKEIKIRLEVRQSDLLLKQAEALFQEKTLENHEEIANEVAKFYDEVAQRLENLHDENDPEYKELFRKLCLSLAHVYIRSEMGEDAWQTVRKVENLNDSKIYLSLAEFFFANPLDIFTNPEDKYSFILLLLKKAGHSEGVNRLILRVFESIDYARNLQNSLNIQQTMLGRGKIILLDDLLEAAALARKHLEQLIENNPDNLEEEKRHFNLLHKIMTGKIFSKEIIGILSSNPFVIAALCKQPHVGSDSVAILEQFLIYPQDFPLQALTISNKPQNELNILCSARANPNDDVVQLCAKLEEKLFGQVDAYVEKHLAEQEEENLEESVASTSLVPLNDEPTVMTEVPSKLAIDEPVEPPHKSLNPEQYLKALWQEIWAESTTWRVRKGEVITLLDKDKNPYNEKIVPRGIKRMLDAISSASLSKDDDAWENALQTVLNIAKTHGHYSKGYMFFVGQAAETQVWYQRVETDIKMRVFSTSPRHPERSEGSPNYAGITPGDPSLRSG